MSRKVLLVDPDVDALGALASALRARGLTVFNASDPFEAVEAAFQHRPDCVLAARSEGEDDLTTGFRAVPELSDTPLLYLVRKKLGLAEDELHRGDLDKVVLRIAEVSPRDSRVPLDQEIRGNVEQMPLVDLLQLLAMNRRSGLLMVTTNGGSGELRLSEGEVVDALFRRVEGEKALYRLLSERDGRFAFTPGEPTATRRIQSSTSRLLMESMRQVDEMARRRKEIAPEGEALLMQATAASLRASALDLSAERTSLMRELGALLQVPRTLDELLDETDALDLTILEVLQALMAAGRLRRIPISELTTPFAPPEQLPVLRSLVSRLTRSGFAPPPRLIIAASAPRMQALMHSIRRITDAVAPGDVPPRAALPRTLGTLRLGDGVELALLGVPTDETYAPTWALALPGAAAVVRLPDAGGGMLEAQCEALEVMLIDAESLMGSVDIAVPGQVAALVRSALEMAAGV